MDKNCPQGPWLKFQGAFVRPIIFLDQNFSRNVHRKWNILSIWDENSMAQTIFHLNGRYLKSFTFFFTFTFWNYVISRLNNQQPIFDYKNVSLQWPASKNYHFFLRLKMSNENNAEMDEIENLLQEHEMRRREELLQLLQNKSSLMDRELRLGRQLIEKQSKLLEILLCKKGK